MFSFKTVYLLNENFFYQYFCQYTDMGKAMWDSYYTINYIPTSCLNFKLFLLYSQIMFTKSGSDDVDFRCHVVMIGHFNLYYVKLLCRQYRFHQKVLFLFTFSVFREAISQYLLVFRFDPYSCSFISIILNIIDQSCLYGIIERLKILFHFNNNYMILSYKHVLLVACQT